MIITAPVTDYIPASILTTNGDMVLRGAAIPGRLAAGAANLFLKAQGLGVIPVYDALALRNTGIHIGNSARNSAGVQVITGVGFQSSTIIFFAIDSTAGDLNSSWGFSSSTTDNCICLTLNGTQHILYNANNMYIDKDGVNFIRSILSAIGGDGFSLTWILGGACGVNFVYLCLP